MVNKLCSKTDGESLFIIPILLLHLLIFYSSFLLKSINVGWSSEFTLWEKDTSVACLLGSGLNDIFHRWAHWFIVIVKIRGRGWNLLLLKKVKWHQQIDWRCVVKSFIYIKKRSGPSIDPCGALASIFFQEELRSFRTTLWFQFFN